MLAVQRSYGTRYADRTVGLFCQPLYTAVVSCPFEPSMLLHDDTAAVAPSTELGGVEIDVGLLVQIAQVPLGNYKTLRWVGGCLLYSSVATGKPDADSFDVSTRLRSRVIYRYTATQ